MATFRVQRSTYYPSLTTLADGKALTLSGSHHQHLEFFGGLKNGETTPIDSAVFRFGIGEGGYSDSPIRTSSTPLWPRPRQGHSGAYHGGGGSYTSVFGGKLATGSYTDELWEMRRQTNPDGSDYNYAWQKSTPVAGIPVPPARWRHAAESVKHDSASMLLFGGIRKNALNQDECTNDVWRYWFRGATPDAGPRWAAVNVTNPTSSSAPGTRAGHATFWHEPSRSMLVFGGRGTPTGNPTDDLLYRLEFTSDMAQATWSKLSVAGPSAREAMALAYSPASHDGHTHAFLFGGENAGGKLNDLWDLKLNATLDTLEWVNRTDSLTGTWPSPRSGHTMFADGANHWLYVFGGTSPVGSADDTVYKAHLGGHTVVTEESRAWEPYARHTAGALTGHVAVFEDGPIYARRPEIFSPSNDWSILSGNRLLEWYPQAFVLKPDEVFVAGPDIVGRKLTLSTGAWSVFPLDSTLLFKGGGAVMYEPGKVMKAGSRDTDGVGSSAVGTTKSVNLNAGAGAYWRSSSNSMAPRVNHNLVLLPNGKVLVVGGTKVVNNQVNTSLEVRPEIWDPALNDSAGFWRYRDTLATQPTMRDYHSTALLLPDGRVLCAGGNAGVGRDSAEIYCPPYLFTNDTLATRPNLVSATGRWRYGADVTFAVSGDTIERVCLIHPGSTTHAQDMAQRYVPLSVLSVSVRSDGIREYFLKAPPDSFAAPPGDYLLFASNPAGVPSIARWVRVGSNLDRQYDTVAPSDLSFSTTYVYCNEISPITWLAPGDDDAVGTAQDYEIRYSFSPITSQNFPQATIMTTVGIPRLFGSLQTGNGFSGLNPATMVYVAGKTWDKAGNASSLAFGEFATLPSCGGGGYGLSVRRSRGDPEDGAAGERGTTSPKVRPMAAPNSLLSSDPTLRLVGEYSEGENLGWRLHYVDFEGSTDLLEATMGSSVVQQGSAEAWTTRETTALPAGAIGLRSLVSGERVVFPGGTMLGSFEAEARGFECVTAGHSRFGDLLASQDPDSIPEFAPGDTLDLGFAPEDSVTAGASWFFRVVVPEGVGTSSARPGSRPETRPTPREPVTLDLPTAFALHSARPNPFSRTTQIRFDLPRASRVEIELFDVQGRRVASLIDEPREAGRHMVVWDGRSASGIRAAAGVYVCRMRGEGFQGERRVSLLP